MLRFLTCLVLVLATANLLRAQSGLTFPAQSSKRAVVSEQIGLCNIEIKYGRPGVKGREGKVWGTTVAHYGFIDQGFGTSTSAPWRAGADENTTISFSNDVKIEGKDLPAGKYGFFMANGETETTIIFSKANNAWGSYTYDPKEDALRLTVKNQNLSENVEWLKYEFENQSDNSAIIALKWEKRAIPFKVEVDVHKVQLASMARELTNLQGFGWEGFHAAANYCLQNNIALEQGLKWADQAMGSRFSGAKNFQTLSTKAGLLMKMGKDSEAAAIYKEAMPMGTMQEIHAYGRTLLAAKKSKEAFEVFKFNHDKNPKQFTTIMGLVRGYSAIGDYPKALEQAKIALPMAPDTNNKSNIESMIKKLEQNKDAN
jgi:tetratricopeptide (TPR) repeat protein